MEELTITLAQRLNKLRQSKNLTISELKSSLKEKYGIDISIESLRNYEVVDQYHSKYGKNEGMNVKYLCCLADFYDVSTDYLLGRAELKSPDTNVQAICEYTGLSERAVSALRSLCNECQTHKTPPLSDKVAELAKFGRIPNEIDMLNYLISNLRFHGVLSDLVEVGQCSVMLQFSMELLDAKQELMLRNFPDGYQLITPFEYSRLARYELSTDFERMVDVFISEIQDYKGGLENAIHQEND